MRRVRFMTRMTERKHRIMAARCGPREAQETRVQAKKRPPRLTARQIQRWWCSLTPRERARFRYQAPELFAGLVRRPRAD